jgi:hypothetical protein
MRGMKYIEVTGWGDEKKHLIPLDKIEGIYFAKNHTTISLLSGSRINIVEGESSIRQMLSYQEAEIISEEGIRELYSKPENYLSDNINKDKLPF